MAKRKHVAGDPIAAARDVARAVVAQEWPELARVEPTVTVQHHAPAGAVDAPAGPTSDEYTFTFMKVTRTPDGYTMPWVARLTVDDQGHVVKVTLSK